MSNIECATLFLTTAVSEYNDEYGLSCTWDNVNLRMVLGQMYEKYDVFSLELAYLGQGLSEDVLNTEVNDSLVFIQLSGLPLINNTYNIITKHNTNSTIIGVFEFELGKTNYQMYANGSKVLFGKNSEQVNITINLLNNELEPPSAVVDYPYMCYSFNIFGIPKEEGNLNNTRMAR
jgi:hypothetical protein